MARRVTFEIITKAQLNGFKQLADALADITKNAKAMNKDLQLDRLSRELDAVKATARDVSQIMGRMDKGTLREMGDQAERSAKNVESLQARFRDLNRATATLDRNRRRLKSLGDDIAQNEERLADARARVATATARLRAVERDPNRTVAQIKEAEQAYDDSAKALARYERQMEKTKTEFRQLAQESVDAERQITDIEDAMKALRKTAGGMDIMRKFLPPSAARDLRVARNAINEFQTVQDATWKKTRADLDRVGKGFQDLRMDVTSLRPTVGIVRNMADEIKALARLDALDVKRAIGSPDAAIRSTTEAYRRQGEEAIKLNREINRLAQASAAWVSAESRARNVLAGGTDALRQRTNVQKQLTAAMADARSIERTADTRQNTLLAQQRRMLQEQLDLTQRINRAQSELVQRPVGTAAYRDMNSQLDRLRQAYTQLDAAIDQNNTNLRENEAILTRARADAASMARSTQNWQSAVQSLVASSRQNPFRDMIRGLQDINQFAMRAANALESRVRSAITTTANAARGFASSAGTMFAGLQRALQSTGSYFERFADRVARSMDRSRAAMMEMYAAGFGLMAVGREINQFGVQGFRMMERSLDQFMEYERMRTIAGIAGAQPVDAQGNIIPEGTGAPAAAYTINSGVIDELIFQLQRGALVPRWMEGERGRLPVTFDATELAQGLYYFSSAIGVPITAENQLDVGEVVSTMMTMAKVTNTGVEQATKGIMNIAMEYGFDPRALGSGDAATRERAAMELSKITAQVGMLSNISTMEVSDIIETFKMVGPMANILSGGAQGAGLDETFLLAFLASEVGLRGGNVGRGINRAFTSLLDPTDKMLDVLGVDEAGFNELFFEPGTDVLKGGIMGFMNTLATMFPEEQQASLLAELFTENATRTLVGMIGEFTKGDGLDEWLENIGGENPFRWLEAAAAESQNTISGWFDFMTNGWFQFTRAMAQSVQGPLMGGFQLIGEFLFELAERIDMFPAIGQTIGAIVTAIMSMAAVGGTVLMIAGGILLLGRAFAMLGGYVLPFIRLMAMASVTLLGLIPLFALIGAAIGLAVYAVRNNVMGLGDAFRAIQNFFSDFEGSIIPFIENLFSTISRAIDAIRILFEGILLGGDMPAGNINNLFAGIESIFGPLLGGSIINGLLRLREALGPTRDAVREFFSESTFDVTELDNVGLAVQGFFEQLFLGRMRAEAAAAMGSLGDAFGISNFQIDVFNAANAMRGFLNQAIGFADQVIGVWASMGRQIWSNITRIFSDTGLSGVFEAIGAVAQGVAQGIIAAFTGILGAVAFVTDKIADFAQSLRRAQAEGRTFMGMAVSFEGVLRAIGTAIGLYFGARLALAFSPLASMLVTIMPLMTGLGAAIIGIGGRLVVMAAQIAITTAAWLAQAAVMGTITAVKMASTAATIALTLAEAGAAGATGTLAGLMTFAATAMTGFAAAMTGGSIAAFLLSASLGTVLAIMAGMVVIVAAIVGVLAAFAAGVTFVAGAMIIWVGATQGIGAAMSALASFLSGAWSGLQFGISVLSTFIGWIHTLAGAISSVIGVGDAFSVMGFMVGAAISAIILLIVGLVGALAVLAVAWTAAWVAANIGPILVVAAIALIVVAVMQLVDAIQSIDWGGAWDGFTNAAENAFYGVMLLTAEFVDGLTSAFAEGIETLLNTALEAGRGAGLAGPLITRLTGGIDTIDLTPTDFVGSVQARIDERQRLQESIKAMDQRDSFELSVSVTGEEELEGFWGWMDKIGMADPVKEFMISIGMDPNNMSLDDLTSGEFMDFLKAPEGIDFSKQMADYGFSDELTQYQRDKSAWDAYQSRIAAGQDPMEARRFLEANMVDVPDAKPEYMDYFTSQAQAIDADVDAAAAQLEETKAKWADAVAGLADMSVQDIFSALYDPLAGGQRGSSVISFLAGMSDSIIQAAQSEGGGQWLNMNELMADIAGSGVRLDESLVGKNMHTALRPAFEILSKQTGVAIETLMADIPIFQAPEQFQAMATVDMTQGISQFVSRFGTQMYETVDTSLQGLINQETGEQFFEYGLDWSELNNFAIGQAILGYDWTLADFVGEVMGISTEAANQVLLDAGLSQEAIDAFSQNMYDGVEEAVLSNAGAYSVLTQEQYEWLHDATQGFTSNVIAMTEEEFGAMSDTMKLILTNMGYTFVISDFIPPEAYAAARDAIAGFGDVIDSASGTVVAALEGANLEMNGAAQTWTEVSRTIDEATGEMMVTLQDADGTQITIPAAKYDEYIASLDTVRQATQQWISDMEALARNVWGPEGDFAFGVIGPSTSTARGVGIEVEGGPGTATSSYGGSANAAGAKALGLPEKVSIKVEADLSAVETDLKAIQTIVNDIGGNDKSTFKITAETSNLTEAADALKKMADAIKDIPKDESFVLNADTSNLSEAADALKKMADAIKNIPTDQSFSLTADTSNLSESGEALKMMADALKSIPSEKTLQISANTSNLSESADALKTMADAMKNLPQDQVLSITANSVNLTETASALADISDAMSRLQNVPTEISVTATTSNLTETASALQDILSAFEGLVSAHAGQMNIVVTATTSNLDETRSALDGIADAMSRISNANLTTISITATTSNLTETRDALQGILDTMGGLVEGHAGQMNLVVTASTNGVDATKESLQSIKDVVTGDNTFTVTVSQSGADDVSTSIGNALGIAKNFAVTWTATIAETGVSATIGTIGGATSAAESFAVTWTATIKESGANTARVAINNATNAALDFQGTYTATLNINDNATSTINNAINRLNAFDGRNVTSTMTTVNRQITETAVRNLGNIGATAATGGWRAGGQAVLVGEEGPEVVWFPNNGYVFTAPETEQMLSQSLSVNSGNPFATTSSRNDTHTSVNNNIKSGDTFNFYGDIKIEDRVAAREFFEEIDRRSGRQVEMARRGMRAVDDTHTW